MKITKYYGPPGTGKTTTLINKVREELDNGMDVKDISYLGFTRASAEEALSRAAKYGFEGKDHWFRTIHSACLYLMRQNKLGGKVVDYQHKKQFCKENELTFTVDADTIEYGDEIPEGNTFFSINSYLKNAKMVDDDWKKTQYSSAFTKDFPALNKKWELYKFSNDLIDFNDMLKEILDLELQIPTRVLFVDEFQDISPLQYDVIKQFMIGKDRVFVGGDDDQAIYRFQAAVPEIFLTMKTDEEYVLPKSYRLRQNILDQSNKFIKLNSSRHEKEFTPRDKDGIFDVMYHPEPWAVFERIMGKTYILTRTNSQVKRLSWMLAAQGKLFKYLDEEKEKNWGWSNDSKRATYHSLCNSNTYHIKIDQMVKYGQMQQGVGSFLKYYIRGYGRAIAPDNITTYLGTIHSSKGREADTVLLYDDITPRIVDALIEMPEMIEDERRVFYVGMTRAKENLVIVHHGFHDGISFEIPKQLGLDASM